ncbi:MAG TPA: DUF6491 family protein [Allosphingosinicella sp.]|nr:DUF6491 family protein [Allosphingosinicella sp.]
MKHILILLAAAAAAPASAAPPPADPEERQVSIPFATHPRAIRNFEAVGNHILYLEDRNRRWYRAELGGACWGLEWAHAIGYDTRGGLGLDRFGAILVEGERCPILSLTRSDGPPRRAKKKKG